MKNFRHLLTLILVSICAVQSAWADRSAPELPAAVTPESGQTYYLYNVMEGKFWCRSTTSTSYPALGTYGDKVTITATGTDNEYYMQWASNNHYLYARDLYIDSTYDPATSLKSFTIAQSNKGYSIQRSPNNTDFYKADEFIGYNGTNGDRLNPALAEGSIHWVFFSVENAEYYMAKHKLYTELGIADNYNFYITQYENVYNNSASTTEELIQAYETLHNAVEVSANYRSPEWTEYPILLQNTSNEKWYADGDRITWKPIGNGNSMNSSLKGTIVVDGDATLVYAYRKNNDNSSLRVYLDGELVNTISKPLDGNNWRKYYLELTAGKHDVVWEAVCWPDNGYSEYNYLSEIGIVNTPTLTPATTTVEGQLGTEMLKLIDPISKAKKVVITGVIGADDWTTIGLMKDAFSIDMSGATAEEIPNEMFRRSNFYFLHSIKLPQGIKRIGDYAFYESDIEGDIVIPNTVESIGRHAFDLTKINSVSMGDNIKEVNEYAFSGCFFLENANWPATLPTIPEYCFYVCFNLRTFEIPEGITEIGMRAFHSCRLFNARIPSTIKRIYYDAFWDTATDQIVIPENAEVNWHAFGHCNNLVYAEWPTSFNDAYGRGYNNGTSGVVEECPKLKDVYFKSPTKVTYNNDGWGFFNGNTLSDITLHVPDYLVTTYKLDPYWSQCNVVGFDSKDISDWTVKQNLTLNAGQRIGGTPNLYIYENVQLVVNGDDIQTIGDLTSSYNFSNYSPVTTQVLSNTDKVNITGDIYMRYWTYNNRWHFVTLPFDMKVSDIVTENGASYAIRYYDGASRAQLGTGSNWKNYSPDDIIPAGTGFIYQTSSEGWTKFKAQNNASKQYLFSNKIFTKSLNQHESDVNANKGWNLVGNPWLSYFSIHRLNFTAPITVWDIRNQTYSAYSIIDDDYAIKPLEAFFVQCPDEVSSISFPIDGRQLTSVIESQSGARQPGWTPADERRLMDIELSNGEQGDKTRLVVNPQAKMDYETTCDASKFLSLDASVPQIYTIQDGEQMAINERPAGDGMIKLGVILPSNGTYTIKSERNALTEAVLVDNENGTETNLAYSAYTFSAPAGATDTRFELHLSAANITGISNVKSTVSNETSSKMYNLNGQRVSGNKNGIYVVDGKKVILK